MLLYTIGHSNHPSDVFLRLVAGKDITRLVDIRSRPYSRFNPQYNKKALEQSLLRGGIEYIYMGDSLGGRPNDPSCYLHGTIPEQARDIYREVDYQAVMQKDWFIDGINVLLNLAAQQTTCILCSEKDPSNCHRHHLVARYLLDTCPEVTIWHILPDGSLLNAASISGNDAEPSRGQLPLEL